MLLCILLHTLGMHRLWRFCLKFDARTRAFATAVAAAAQATAAEENANKQQQAAAAVGGDDKATGRAT